MATFLIASAGATVTGTTDKDTFEIISPASAVTVMGLGEDDTVKLSASSLQDSFIKLGAGDDTISTAVVGDLKSSTINGGPDDDTITLDLQGATTVSTTLRGNEGKDTFTLTLSGLDATASSLNLGTNAGDDTIQLISNTSALGFSIGAGADDDKITLSGGAYTDSTIAGGFGEDVITADADIDKTLVRLGQGSDSGTDSADTYVGNGMFKASTIKAGAGKDTITLSGTNFTSSVIEGNDGDDTITMSAATTYSALEIRGGAGNDTITFSGATTNQSADIYGGAGNDVINVTNGTGMQIYGGLGADSATWENGGANYKVAFGDSTQDSMDTIDMSGATSGQAVAFEFDSDIGVNEEKTYSAIVFNGVTADVSIGTGGIADLSSIASDMTAAVGYLTQSVSADNAVAFVLDGAGSGSVTTGDDIYLFVKGSDTDTVVELNEAIVSGETIHGDVALSTATTFGSTTITLTM
jgi:phage protein U